MEWFSTLRVYSLLIRLTVRRRCRGRFHAAPFGLEDDAGDADGEDDDGGAESVDEEGFGRQQRVLSPERENGFGHDAAQRRCHAQNKDDDAPKHVQWLVPRLGGEIQEDPSGGDGGGYKMMDGMGLRELGWF